MLVTVIMVILMMTEVVSKTDSTGVSGLSALGRNHPDRLLRNIGKEREQNDACLVTTNTPTRTHPTLAPSAVAGGERRGERAHGPALRDAAAHGDDMWVWHWRGGEVVLVILAGGWL